MLWCMRVLCTVVHDILALIKARSFGNWRKALMDLSYSSCLPCHTVSMMNDLSVFFQLVYLCLWVCVRASRFTFFFLSHLILAKQNRHHQHHQPNRTAPHYLKRCTDRQSKSIDCLRKIQTKKKKTLPLLMVWLWCTLQRSHSIFFHLHLRSLWLERQFICYCWLNGLHHSS